MLIGCLRLHLIMQLLRVLPRLHLTTASSGLLALLPSFFCFLGQYVLSLSIAVLIGFCQQLSELKQMLLRESGAFHEKIVKCIEFDSRINQRGRSATLGLSASHSHEQHISLHQSNFRASDKKVILRGVGSPRDGHPCG